MYRRHVPHREQADDILLVKTDIDDTQEALDYTGGYFVKKSQTSTRAKFKAMVFWPTGSHQPLPDLHLNSDTIPWVTEHKTLGLHITSTYRDIFHPRRAVRIISQSYRSHNTCHVPHFNSAQLLQYRAENSHITSVLRAAHPGTP